MFVWEEGRWYISIIYNKTSCIYAHTIKPKKNLEYIDTVIRTLTCLKVFDGLDTQIQLYIMW